MHTHMLEKGVPLAIHLYEGNRQLILAPAWLYRPTQSVLPRWLLQDTLNEAPQGWRYPALQIMRSWRQKRPGAMHGLWV